MQIEPSSTPEAASTGGDNIIKNIDIPVVPALDGQGYAVGAVGPSHIHIEQTRQGTKISDSKFSLSSQFYNGSGTWRGSQNIVLTFKFENGDTQQWAPIALDRTRCIYGKAMPFASSGALDPSKGIVADVEVFVSRVTGVQTPC